jgi:hypothetical protein
LGAEEFKYSALRSSEEIRLPRLLSGTDIQKAIRCETYAVPSLISARYKALSYAWGDQNTKMPIELNGWQFFVGKNLWWALYRLRQISQGRVLWIDAICINQNDILERKHQVLKMGDIYESAEHVLAWLGREEPSAETAASPLQNMAWNG